MKIGDIGGLERIQTGPEVSGKKKALGTEEFGRLLAEELNPQTTAPLSPSTMPERVAGIEPSMEMPPVTACQDCQGERQALEALGSLEERLGRIEHSLSDPDISLKALDDVIGSLAGDARQLEQGLSALPDGHPMRQTGEELQVLAYVESVKWARGDYL